MTSIARTGHKNPKAKLTEDNVESIKELYISGLTQYQLAKRFGVTQSAISKILSGTRWAHTADMSDEIATSRADSVRFHRSYRKMPNGCWLWKKSTFNSYTGASGMPYGQFATHCNGIKKNWLAHRWMYQHIHGSIPEGMCVCHKCDVPQCVNPDHLFLGTLKDNSQDRNRKGRNADVSGEKNAMSVLSEIDVLEIRRAYMAGETQASLALRFSLSRNSISKIVISDRWKHLVSPSAEELLHRAKVGMASSSFKKSKLGEDDVRLIRLLHSQGVTSTALGGKYGITPDHIMKIVNRVCWVNI